MTETQRQNLLTACAFAEVFVQAADAELRGGLNHSHRQDLTAFRQECTDSLVTALRNLEPPAADVPVVDWQAIGRELDPE